MDDFGRFKLKQKNESDNKPGLDEFKRKYLEMIAVKKIDYKVDLLNKIKEKEAGKSDEVFGNDKVSNNNATELKDEQNANIKRTPFGDIVPPPNQKKNEIYAKKRSLHLEEDTKIIKKVHGSKCCTQSDDKPCPTCNRLPQPQPLPNTIVKKKPESSKPKKLFNELFQDITFSLSGYVNPQRNEIREKALRMGAKYIANPNTTNNKCTHLICAFKNTPKYQQLKDHCKIVSHKFIEDCYNERKRFPWRKYALDSKDQNDTENEEEILCFSREGTPNLSDVDTD